MSAVHVVAVIQAKPGHRDAVLDAVRANLASVRAEDGCIAYGPFGDAPGSRAPYGPDAVVILEHWASAEALEAHRTAPHMAEFRTAIAGLVAGPATVHVLIPSG